jgi:hypothetical protein
LSAVAGLTSVDNHLVAAVSRERSVAASSAAVRFDFFAHWDDQSTSDKDASLIFLSKDGSMERKLELSSGLNMSVRGIDVDGNEVLMYGSAGNHPALTMPPH